ncbi:MAG: hypothetical protein PGN07_09475 [Aeromicrobium erythreum]
MTTTTTTTSPRGVRRVSGALGALVLALGGLLAVASPASAVSQADAEAQLRAVGITWTSSGGCTDRSNPTCTSFEGLRQTTIDGAKTLKRASGCALTITGGTETGHAGGTQSHSTGYKLDFSRTSCLTSYVTNTFTYAGKRSDGASLYRAASGNLYADEGNHWDVLFTSCGGC